MGNDNEPVDEVGAKRRANADKPADVRPRDALVEAMTNFDTAPEGFTFDHVVVLMHGHGPDSRPMFVATSGGTMSPDAVLGWLTRVVTILAMQGDQS